MPKLSRYTIGTKIDALFLETIECIVIAGYAQRDQKLPIIKQASSKMDLLKFFFKLAWEMKALQDKEYLAVSTPLVQGGKMLGGWSKQLQQETPIL